MRATIMHTPRDMRVGTWETPHPGPGEALISIKAAGICAGDMHIFLGRSPYARYPLICGHEMAGVVIEVGGNVRGIEPGTSVAVEPFISCGSCYPCRIGKNNCCTKLQIMGVTRPGGYAEYLTAPSSNVHPLPAGISFSHASFAEPVAVAVHACRRGNVTAGEDVLVLGCGPIGLALIEVAKARGAHPIAADVLPSRLDVAAALGAETMLADKNIIQRVLDRTNNEGMPVVMEATGNVQAVEQTVELVAAGGRIVIVGLIKEGAGATFPGLDFTRKEMTVVGSRASVNCFPEALQLLSDGSITYPRMAIEFDLWDAPEVFNELAANPGSVHKGVLVRAGED